jgi:hypothetical protein
MQTLDVMAQTAAPQKMELKSAASAKRALADMDSRSFSKIKDERMRKAIQQSHKALKAVASNKSEAKEAKLMEEFNRTITNLKALPQPTGGGTQACDKGYDDCILTCSNTPGADCKQCGWGQNLCYLVKLGMEQAQSNDPSKN